MFKTTKTGYRYNREMFVLWFFITVLIIVSYYFYQPLEMRSGAFFNCTYVTGCRNELYWDGAGECKKYGITEDFIVYQTPACSPSYAWLNQQWLPQGVYGREMPKTSQYLLMYALWMLIVVFIINHFAYNRGKIFDIEIVIWKDAIINLHDLLEKGKK